MSIYLLSNEILFHIGTFLSNKDQVSASRANKHLYYGLQCNLHDNKEPVEWSCTFWVKEPTKIPVIAIVYPDGYYQQAKDCLDILPSIHTPGHAIYHSRRYHLSEYTQYLGCKPPLLKLSEKRCYLRIVKKGKTFNVIGVNMDRKTYKKGHRIVFVQDAMIFYP